MSGASLVGIREVPPRFDICGRPDSFKYRPDIDGLRAIAVAAVVGFHAFPQQVPGGFIGVDVFFVISGFLISGIILDALNNGNFTFADFYARRIKRILPALLFVVTVSYYVASQLSLPDELKRTGEQVVAAGTFLINFLLWHQYGYFDTAAQTKPLLHLWSLGIEEQFYLVWPGLLVVFFRRKGPIGLLLAIIIVLSFTCNVLSVDRSTAAAFYSPASRFWELMCGAVLAYWANVGQWRPSTASLLAQGEAVAGIASVIAAALAFNSRMDFPGWWALIPVIGACLIIHAGPETLLNRMILSWKPLVWLGLISYSLYLWHWPLLSFAYLMEGPTLTIETRLVLVLASLIFAVVTYLVVERPIRFWRGHDATKVTALCGATIGLICVGLYAFANDGVATAYQRAFAIRYFDMTEDWRGGRCLIGPDSGWPINEAAGVTNFGECVEGGTSPLLVLWGDSFAAHLYPGLKHQAVNHHYRIAQFTFNACLPVIDVDFPGRPYCRSYQRIALEKIIELSPAYLLMAAAWNSPSPMLRESTVSTIEEIHARSPSTRIIVVGRPPLWKEAVPRILQRLSTVENGHLISLPPIRIIGETLPNIDSELEEIAATTHISYFSSWNVLCNDDGCLTRKGRDFQNLFSLDAGHLTPIASDLVAKQLVGDALTGRASASKDN
jgi:peptidoglycan/LPS O-acetylase OafA/YrhL